MEIFVDIKGFEDYYQIGNKGTVKSKDRKIICSNGDMKPIKGRILSPGDNGRGYMFVNLWKGNKQHRYYVHRLVAMHFISNPDNLKEINHKDSNTKNNDVSNLEWCNRLYNERQKKKHISGYKPIHVKQIDVEGNCVSVYESIHDCSRKTGISTSTLYKSFYQSYYIYIDGKKYKFVRDGKLVKHINLNNKPKPTVKIIKINL